jgi:hypothetical protein
MAVLHAIQSACQVRIFPRRVARVIAHIAVFLLPDEFDGTLGTFSSGTKMH